VVHFIYVIEMLGLEDLLFSRTSLIKHKYGK